MPETGPPAAESACPRPPSFPPTSGEGGAGGGRRARECNVRGGSMSQRRASLGAGQPRGAPAVLCDACVCAWPPSRLACLEDRGPGFGVLCRTVFLQDHRSVGRQTRGLLLQRARGKLGLRHVTEKRVCLLLHARQIRRQIVHARGPCTGRGGFRGRASGTLGCSRVTRCTAPVVPCSWALPCPALPCPTPHPCRRR